LALQGPPLQVTASVDRTRVQVGEELVYSLRAVTAAIGSFRVELPQIDGLETVERSERTDRVIAARPGTRVFVLELRLRASDLGTWRLAPVLVLVGSQSGVAPEVTVTVSGSSGAAGNPALNPRLLALIQRARSPGGGVATLTTLASAQQAF